MNKQGAELTVEEFNSLSNIIENTESIYDDIVKCYSIAEVLGEALDYFKNSGVVFDEEVVISVVEAIHDYSGKSKEMLSELHCYFQGLYNTKAGT